MAIIKQENILKVLAIQGLFAMHFFSLLNFLKKFSKNS